MDMRKTMLGSIAILAGLSLLLGGCGFYHRTIKENTIDAGAISNAGKFMIRPISFAKMNGRPEAYETDQEWATDVADIHKEYAEEVAIVAEEYGLKDKTVMLTTNQEVSEGILVEADVIGMRLEYNAFSGGFDFLTTAIKFTDVASGKVLYEGEIETSSKRMGLVGWKGASFPGRVSMACWNVVRPLFAIMKYGQIKPKEM